MDALTHAVEGYTSLLSEPLTDSLAVTAIRLIGKSLRQAYANGGNLEARYDMALASLVAGLAFGNSDIAAVHCMGEAVGGLYDTPHGIAMAIYLPVVTEFSCIAVPEKYAVVAEALGEDVCGPADGRGRQARRGGDPQAHRRRRHPVGRRGGRAPRGLPAAGQGRLGQRLGREQPQSDH